MELVFVKCALCLNKCLPSTSNYTKGTNVNNEIPRLQGDDDSSLLKDQLNIIFLLRKVLEIPQEQCCKFLQDYGDPSMWIDYCNPCLVLVEKAKTVFDLIIVLQKKFEILQEEIKNKIIQTWTYEENVVDQREWGVKETIRSFTSQGISIVKTIVPKEEIFGDFPSSDLNATELNDFSLENLNSCVVKNEMIDDADPLLSRHNEWVWERCPLKQEEIGISHVMNDASKEEISTTELNTKTELRCVSLLSLNSDYEQLDPLGLDDTDETESNFHIKESTPPRRRKQIFPKELNTVSETSFQGNARTSSGYQEEINVARNSNSLMSHLRMDAEENPQRQTSVFPDLNSQTGQKPHECGFCGKCFEYPIQLSAHEKTHTGGKVYNCGICGRKFTTAGSLKRHGIFHTRERPYKCNVCLRSFALYQNLKMHEKIHSAEKAYKCKYCGKAFTRSMDLKYHEKGHTGQEPYKCTLCGKGFVKLAGFQAHISTHTGEKPYRCDICEIGFSRSCTLRRHHQSIHTGEKPYRCIFCGRAFKLAQTLKMHKRIHTGESLYKCKVCGKSFRKSIAMKLHERIHTGERPYKCDVCGMAFRQSCILKAHKRIHA